METAAVALERITRLVPGAEDRPGQNEMAEAVARVLASGGTLLVEAGTGTGKSLAYLVPALVSARRPVVVATATKALQDQLLEKDIPTVAAGLDRPVTAVSVKGRASYLCRAKEAEARQRLDLGDKPEMAALLDWAQRTETGDRAELDPAPLAAAWAELSVSGQECPGAGRCPHGEECLSEAARRAASEADLVVVNHALLATDLVVREEAGEGFLPSPGAIVIDEAHRLEESLSSALGHDISQSRCRYAAGLARGLLSEQEPADQLEAAGADFLGELRRHAGSRVDTSIRDEVTPAAVRLSNVIARLAAAVQAVPDQAGDRRERLRAVLVGLAVDLQQALEERDDVIAWVEAEGDLGRLRTAPLEVAAFTRAALFEPAAQVPVVLTSATLSFAGSFAHLRHRLGIDEATELRVESPFDYRAQGLLYVARHLPDPRQAGFDEAARAETLALLEASGGRAFCLYTSWRAMQAAHAEIGPQLDCTVLAQGEAGPGRLIERLRQEAPAVLFATVSFWQGVDVPGDALQLVILDKLPFSSPGDPLAAARVEAVRQRGGDWFAEEVLPRAGLLLAQGVGRLIRRRDDRGVVAVLDRRLATAGYRQALLATLPPLRRTTSFEEVSRFFDECQGARRA